MQRPNRRLTTASGLRLAAAIKAPGGVFLQDLTGRLWAAQTPPPPPPAQSRAPYPPPVPHARIGLRTPHRPAVQHSPSFAFEQDTTVHASASSSCVGASESRNPRWWCRQWGGGDTGLPTRTVVDCSTGFLRILRILIITVWSPSSPKISTQRAKFSATECNSIALMYIFLLKYIFIYLNSLEEENHLRRRSGRTSTAEMWACAGGGGSISHG